MKLPSKLWLVSGILLLIAHLAPPQASAATPADAGKCVACHSPKHNATFPSFAERAIVELKQNMEICWLWRSHLRTRFSAPTFDIASIGRDYTAHFVPRS